MLYVTHCVDAEGPLHETVEATFERLRSLFGLALPPSRDLLTRLQRGEHDVGSAERAREIASAFNAHNLATLADWSAIDSMLDQLDEPQFRLAIPDSRGQGWHVNWHCVAHWGYDPLLNPRRRDLGVHNVFDHYAARYGLDGPRDSIHWHFHPVAFSRQANHSATSYFNTPALFEIVSRRVLERDWFPCANRPGFHAERPDSHWFLEQWLPYDLANLNCDPPSAAGDARTTRWANWQRAPKEWVIYHPHHDDYQQPGSCRRAIARCLNLNGRFAAITQGDVNQAFAAARDGRDVVMAFTNHDFRDLCADARSMQEMLRMASRAYPDTEWCYSDAVVAMRRALGHGDAPPARIELSIAALDGGGHRLDVRLDREPFGPQPWLCMATKNGRVYHDNLAIEVTPLHWTYVFDEESVPLGAVERIGLATNTANGRTSISTMNAQTGATSHAFHNLR